MKKLILTAAVAAALTPSVMAQTATDEGDVKSICVGEFENPGQAEYKEGQGSFWEVAPVNFYTKYSGMQVIYPAEYLQTIAEDSGSITEVVFKMGDEGSMGYADANIKLYIQNTDANEFVKKPDTEKYLWQIYDDSHFCDLVYEGEFYYMEDQEFHFVLNEPLFYEGENLLITVACERTSDLEINTLCSYAMRTENKCTMFMADDKLSFEEVYATTFYLYPMSPLRYVPVAKFMYTTSTGVNSVATTDSDAPARYFNLHGQPVSGNLAPGLYICNKGGETTKVLVK